MALQCFVANGSLLLSADDRGRSGDVSIDMGTVERSSQMQLLQEQVSPTHLIV